MENKIFVQMIVYCIKPLVDLKIKYLRLKNELDEPTGHWSPPCHPDNILKSHLYSFCTVYSTVYSDSWAAT